MSLPRRLASSSAVLASSLLPVQWVLMTALAVDGALVLAGLGLVPEAVRSPAGIGRVLADLGLLALIGAAALVGPMAFSRLRDIDDVCLCAGSLFAFVYLLHLLLGFSGRPPGLNPWWFFVVTALVASAWATLRTHQFLRGVAAACWALVVGTAIWSAGLMAMSYAYWDTADGYAFWMSDGAISDFHRSGGSSLPLFLVQDIEGAVFFHPLRSVAVGAACGAVGAAGGLGARRLLR